MKIKNFKYLCFILIIAFSCDTKTGGVYEIDQEKDLVNETFWRFYHIDTYDLVQGEGYKHRYIYENLSAESMKTLIEILEEDSCPYYVVGEGNILVSQLWIPDIDAMAMYDDLIDLRISQQNSVRDPS